MTKAHELKIRNFAMLREVDLRFGALTVLVGAQATGKSLALQLLKLALDGRNVAEELRRNGYTWEDQPASFTDRVFGQGMGSAWGADTAISWTGSAVPQMPPTKGKTPLNGGKLFYIPAQRTLTMPEGWPRPFTSFAPDTPYVVREFSEKLRVLMNEGLGKKSGASVFPQTGRLRLEYRKAIDKAIFHGAALHRSAVQGRNQLQLHVGATELSYMTWTAGQREFIPLLLGLYHLMPSDNISKLDTIDWVVVEEPEMGLHPQGVLAVTALLLELVARGYRVVVSTHSPTLLDVVWAMNVLADKPGGAAALRRGLGLGQGVEERLQTALSKTREVHLLKHDGDKVDSRRISALDPGADTEEESGWGGLTGLDGRLGDEVARAVSAAEAAK